MQIDSNGGFAWNENSLFFPDNWFDISCKLTPMEDLHKMKTPYFSQITDLTFHANCLQSHFLRKKKKKNIINFSSAELAQRVIKVISLSEMILQQRLQGYKRCRGNMISHLINWQNPTDDQIGLGRDKWWKHQAWAITQHEFRINKQCLEMFGSPWRSRYWYFLHSQNGVDCGTLAHIGVSYLEIKTKHS